MNEQVIDDLYARALQSGYKKGRADFVQLIQSNEDVFNDMYQYVQSKGYTKDAQSFSSLVGKRTAPTVKKKVTASVSEPGSLVSPEPEVPVETAIAPATEAAEPATTLTGAADPDFFEERMEMISPQLIDRGDEDEVAQELTDVFKPYGFDVEPTSIGDAIKVTAANGQTIEVDLDPWEMPKILSPFGLDFNTETETAEAKKLQDFLRENRQEGLDAPRRFVTNKQRDDEVKRINQKQKEITRSAQDYLKRKLEFQNKYPQFLTYDPEYIKNNPEEYQRFLNDRGSLEKEREFLVEIDQKAKEEGAQLDRLAGEYTEMLAQRGYWSGGVFRNVFIQGIANIAAGANDFALDTAYDPKFLMETDPEFFRDNYLKEAADKGYDVPSASDMTVDEFKAWMKTDEGIPAKESIAIQTSIVDTKLKSRKRGEPIDYEEALNAYSQYATSKNMEVTDGELAALRKSLDFLKDPESTPEAADLMYESFWGGALLGVTHSLPAILVPGGFITRTAAMYFQISSALEQEMAKDPDFQNISEAERFRLKLAIGSVSSVLEAVGFRNVLKQKGLLTGILMRVLKKTPANVKGKAFNEVVMREVNSAIGRGALVATSAGLAEFETGFLQEGVDISFKNIYNEMKEKEMFETPETWSWETLNRMLYAGAQEAVGGFVMGTPGAISAARRSYDFTAVDDATFEMFENVSSQTARGELTYRHMFYTNLQAKINQGKISKEDAQQEMDNLDEVIAVNRDIPSDLTVSQKKRALGILLRKKDLQEQIEGKDPILVKRQQEELNSLNGELDQILYGTPETDAIQEPSPETVDAPESTRGSEAVGEGVPDIGEPTTKIEAEDDAAPVDERQAELDDAISKADAEVAALRESDGSVSKKNEAAFKEAVKRRSGLQTSGEQNKGAFSLKEKAKVGKDAKFLSKKQAAIADKMIQAIIDYGLKKGLSAEEIYNQIISRHAFELPEVQAIKQYVAGLVNNTTEQGNSKQSFSAWRQAKMDSDLTTETKTPEDAIQEPSPETVDAPESTRDSEAVGEGVPDIGEPTTEVEAQDDVTDEAPATTEEVAVEETVPVEAEEVRGDNISNNNPLTIQYNRNLAKSPNMGSQFGQDVEAAGAYITQKEQGFTPEGFETGTVQIQNPLVIDVTQDTQVEYKRTLSSENGGKTGTALSNALKKKGYDAIITKNEDGSTGEIILLNNISTYQVKKKKAAPVKKAAPKKAAPKKTVSEPTQGVTEEEQVDIDEFFGEQDIEGVEKVSENLVINRKQKAPTADPKSQRLMNRVRQMSVKAAASIRKIAPEVKILIHESPEEYQRFAGEQTAGNYDPKTKTIHINLGKANLYTAPHEVFHALLLQNISTDSEALTVSRKMLESVRKVVDPNSQMAKDIDEFVARYGDAPTIQDEEYLAQLTGILTAEYRTLNKPAKNAVKDFLRKLAKMLGLEKYLGPEFLKTDEQVIDLLNTISRRMSEGEYIEAADVQAMGDILSEATPAEQAQAQSEVEEFNRKERERKAAEEKGIMARQQKADGQVFTFGQDTYDINKADNIIKNNKVDIIDVSASDVPSLSFFFVTKTEEGIKNADISQPVIFATTPNGLLLIDGHHRAERAARDGKPLKGYVLSEEQTSSIMPSETAVTPRQQVSITDTDSTNPSFEKGSMKDFSVEGGILEIGKVKGAKQSSVLRLSVDEDNRRQGKATELLKSALNYTNGMLSAMASKDAAVGLNYKLGMRAFSPDGNELSLEETKNQRAENAGESIRMELPDSKKGNNYKAFDEGMAPRQQVADAATSIQESLKFADKSSFPNKLEFKRALQERFDNEVYPLIKERYGVKDNRSNTDQGLKDYLVDAYLNETLTAIEAYPDALGWYDARITGAMSLMEKLHPELATDKDAASTFKIALAITSNGNKVYDNFVEANRQYEYFKENGKFDDTYSIGDQRAGILSTLAFTNKALESMSMADFTAFLTTKYRAGDLKYMKDGKKTPLLPGFAVDEEVYGASIFGPKIGNGFFMNLYGEFNQLTMDRWFMRQFGRLTGTLIDYDQKKVDAGTKRLNRATKALAKRNGAKLSDMIPGWDKMSAEELSNKIQKASMDLEKRAILKSNPKLDEVRKAGNNLSKQVSAEVEAPRNSSQRKFINEVFTELQAKLKNDYDIDITIADLQAVNWYPEKALYQTFKADQSTKTGKVETSDNEQPDYESAAKKLVEEQGVSKKEIKEDEARRSKQLERNTANREAIEQRAGELNKDDIEASEVKRLKDKIISVKEDVTSSDLEEGVAPRQQVIDDVTAKELDTPLDRQQRVFRSGDLQNKAEPRWMFQSGRGTGHFGTGFYFFGTKEQADKYDARDVSEIDIDKYNLAKATKKLHDALKDINTQYNEYYEVEAINELKKEPFRQAVPAFFIEEVAKAAGMDVISEKDEKIFTSKSANGKSILESQREKSKAAKERGEIPFENILITQDELEAAATEVTEALKKDGNPAFGDSVSTLVMKALGFEGVNAVGTRMDNSTYGTVIYDLKEDVAPRQQVLYHVTVRDNKGNIQKKGIEKDRPPTFAKGVMGTAVFDTAGKSFAFSNLEDATKWGIKTKIEKDKEVSIVAVNAEGKNLQEDKAVTEDPFNPLSSAVFTEDVISPSDILSIEDVDYKFGKPFDKNGQPLTEESFDIKDDIAPRQQLSDIATPLPRQQKSVREVVQQARDNNFKDAATKDFLQRKGVPTADIDKAIKTLDDVYARVMKEIDGVITKSQKRGVDFDTQLKNALAYLQGTKLYENTTDIHREKLMREVRAKFDKKEKRAPSAKRILGNIKDVKTVTLKEKEALKMQLRLVAKTAKTTARALVVAGNELTKSLKEMVKGGVITANQMSSVLRRFSRVDLFNPASIDSFLDYMAKIFADAEYGAKIARIKKLLPRAKKNIKSKIGVADVLGDTLTKLFNVNPTLIPMEMLEGYQNLLEMMGAAKKVLPLADINDVTEMANKLLNAVYEEVSMAEDLAEVFANYENKVIKDGKLDYAATVRAMIADETISEAEATVMIKYKSRIVEPTTKEPKTEAEIAEERAELMSAVEAAKVNVSRLVMDEERTLARQLAKLMGTEAIERLSNQQLETLLAVIDNINNGFVTHAANRLYVNMNALNNDNQLADSLQEADPLSISKFVAKIKGGITQNNKFFEAIKRRPLAYIDSLFGDFKTNRIYNSVFRPLAKAFDSMNVEIQRIEERLDNAENAVRKSFKRNPNKVRLSSYKRMTYMLQREFEANPDNGQVNPASDFIRATIDHINEGKSFFKGRDAEMLQQILDDFGVSVKDADGNDVIQIDSQKLYDSFNKAERNAIVVAEDINKSLASKASFTAAVIQGRRADILNQYAHHNVLSSSEQADKSTSISEIQKYNQSLRASTKAKNSIERTGAVTPLNFDVLTSVSRGAKMMLTDFYLTDPVRTSRKTISNTRKVLEERGNATKQDKEILNAIDQALELALDDVLTKTFTQGTMVDNIIQYISKTGYRVVLASVSRFGAEGLSNSGFVSLFAPKQMALGLSKENMKLSIGSGGTAVDILSALGSTQISRLFPDQMLSGRMIDTSVLGEKSGDKGGRAYGEVANKMLQIYNGVVKPGKEGVERVADGLISTPDKAVIRPLWFGSFEYKFEELTKKKPDMDKIAANDEAYMDANQKALDEATDYADQMTTFAGAADNPFKGLLKGKYPSSVKQSAMLQAFNISNSFMTRFLIYEFISAQIGTYAMMGRGMISKRQGAALLGAVATRMVVYTLLTTLFAQIFKQAFGLGDEEEKDIEKQFGQALASTAVSLIVGRDFGNIVKGLLNYGVENFNEEFLDDLRDGDYDPYRDSIAYTFVPPDREYKSNTLADYIRNLMGPFGPFYKMAEFGVKTLSADEKKDPAARIRQQRELNERLPLELLGNLGLIPLYRDIRALLLADIYKGMGKEKKGSSTGMTKAEKAQMKEYFPELYEMQMQLEEDMKNPELERMMKEQEKAIEEMMKSLK